MSIEIKQHDITDCSAACLASIAAHYGLLMPIARIRQIASTDRRGTNVLGVTTAAEKLGFSAKGVKALNQDGTKKIAPLQKIPLPAIAHVLIDGRLSHYVVIYKVTDKWLRIMDPAVGKVEKWNFEKFEQTWTGILILMLPDDSVFQKGSEKVSIMNRFLYLLKPHKAVIIQAIFGAVIYTILGLATSVFVQKIIDYVLPDNNANLLNLMGVVMVCILILSLIINYCKSIFIFKTGQKIDARLILGYYKHLLKLPQSFFDNMRTGEIISRIGDAMKIRSFINETLVSLIVSVFTILFAFGLMFTYYWKLALIILIIIPLYAFIYYLYNRVNKKTQRKIMENAADLESHLVESLNAVGTIKRFGMETFANTKTETRFITLLDSIYRSGVNALISTSATGFIAQAFTIILLWAGSYFVFDKEITPGELLSFYALIGYFIGPIGSLIGMNLAIQDAKIAADRLFEIMDLKQEDTEQKIDLERSRIGDIVFENVRFAYGTRTEVFEDFNLTISKGEITAIVGESGSGKSTLAALLQNIYPITGGSIKLGDINIKHIESDSLRQLISVVPQKIDLFEGSIIDNIALGDYEPDMQKILNICSAIGITGFIDKLPAGFGTNIGENGVKLSGGQRQRLAIARALYRDPDILILDEATSALDSESESHIKHVIQELRKQRKTVLIIAHRLGTITNADSIVVLESGKVVDQGTHNELILKKGSYYQLVKNQLDLGKD
ncbi:peptidase domain-containing ABC transporter [Culturomica massiliensis]|jgi:ABC-type bacteriocin transporter|uniref:peptidase domain-containing ABC transporter n=1 Tax=Culturomica massiliensis TaxID=1841857 RepID=UPI002664FF0C|nr:peptidase domain-containing ABC transporter [Culturomica massiliensis]